MANELYADAALVIDEISAIASEAPASSMYAARLHDTAGLHVDVCLQ